MLIQLSLSESRFVTGGRDTCYCVNGRPPLLTTEATLDFWEVLRQLTGENYNCNIDPSNS